MIKVSVLYPNKPGAKFDMDYYCTKHMPLVQQRLGAACKSVAVEQGIAGAAPGAPAASATAAANSSMLSARRPSPSAARAMSSSAAGSATMCCAPRPRSKRCSRAPSRCWPNRAARIRWAS